MSAPARSSEARRRGLLRMRQEGRAIADSGPSWDRPAWVAIAGSAPRRLFDLHAVDDFTELGQHAGALILAYDAQGAQVAVRIESDGL
jgi:hypothetical protein